MLFFRSSIYHRSFVIPHLGVIPPLVVNLLFGVSLLLGLPLAWAQGLNPASRTKQSEVFSYRLDPTSVQVDFEAVGNPSALKIHGKCSQLKADLRTESNRVSGSVVFPLDCLETGIELRDRHMKEKYLETARFPESRLVLEGVNPARGEQSFQGMLSLHGVSRLVQGKFTLTDAKDQKEEKMEGSHGVGVQARFTIKLTDFQIQLPSFAKITVADEVTVSVKFKAAEMPPLR
jgi:polyisoprenoid-binding protein YceI